MRSIFKKSQRNDDFIGTNEGITIEYKESFGWASLSEYLRAMASFANRDGGYIIFGIMDHPHKLIGLQEDSLKRFQKIDNARISTEMKEYLSPEVIWDKTTFEYEGKIYGIIYTYPARNKPVICKKSSGELRKSAIYYRYNSQNSEIEYSELNALIENEKNKIHEMWMKMIKQIGDQGMSHTAILDLNGGQITGANNTLYIDENLVDQLSFVQEGSFVETGGNPALILRGEVQTMVGAQKIIVQNEREKAIHSDDILMNFILQNTVSSPKEYITQICYSNTANMPVYFYIHQANLSSEQVITLIENLKSNTNIRKKLVERFLSNETKYLSIPKTESEATKKKEDYLAMLLDGNVELPTKNDDLRYMVIALRALTKDQVKENTEILFNILYKLYTSYYTITQSNLRYEIRYAICWIDEALYK